MTNDDTGQGQTTTRHEGTMSHRAVDTEVIGIIRELSHSYPGITLWTEIDYQQHRIWLARGADDGTGPHPWLMASDSLARFQSMLASL